jgi:hypothetical protein
VRPKGRTTSEKEVERRSEVEEKLTDERESDRLLNRLVQ